MIVRNRFQPDKRYGFRLEPRDKALIIELFTHRAMSREQILKLGFFNSVGCCNARLRKLFDEGLVRRHFLPLARYGSQAVYSTGCKAALIIAQSLEIDIEIINKQLKVSSAPRFLEHTLEIVNFRIQFEEALESHGEFQIIKWLPEYLCRHEYRLRSTQINIWRRYVFKPDAFIRLLYKGGTNNTSFDFFLEIDLGHTSSNQWKKKLSLYHHYLHDGVYKETYGKEKFHVLVVTTGTSRIKHLLAIANECKVSTFLFTTFEQIKSEGLLAAIWQSIAFDKYVSLADMNILRASV